MDRNIGYYCISCGDVKYIKDGKKSKQFIRKFFCHNCECLRSFISQGYTISADKTPEKPPEQAGFTEEEIEILKDLPDGVHSHEEVFDD